MGILRGWHKVDNACPIKIPTVASSLRDSKVVMQFFRNRAVPLGVLRSKIEQFNKTERLKAARDKRKIRCIPTSKVRKINDVVVFVVVVVVDAVVAVASDVAAVSAVVALADDGFAVVVIVAVVAYVSLVVP